MKKHIVLLLVCLALLLTACGGNTSTTDASKSVSSTPLAEVAVPDHDGTENEAPKSSEAPSDRETPNGDSSKEGTTVPRNDVDLPKVAF